MKNSRRRVLWFALALAPVFLTVFLVRFQGQIERQKRDYALIAAIKTDDFNGARRLLDEGANPNFRDAPPDTRTLWQKFLNVLRPAAPEDRAAPSALSLVVGRYVYYGFEEPTREKRFALLQALRDAGAQPEGDAPPFQSRRAALAEETRNLTDSPMLAGSARTPDEICADLQAGLSAVGVSAQVYGLLGRCYEKSGEQDYAVRAYRVALLWLPDDANLRARFAELTAAPTAKRSIARTLPAGVKILRLQVFQTAGGRRQWAVLRGRQQSERQFFGLRAALYQEDGGVFTRLCQSPPLVNPKNVNAVFNQADLFVVRATGRLLPEIATRIIHNDPTWAPSHLDIWQMGRGRFENILSLSSDDAPTLEDLRHDGRYEARNDILVSVWPYDEMAEKWRRRDVYAFNGRRYVFADPDFPEQFADCLKDGEEKRDIGVIKFAEKLNSDCLKDGKEKPAQSPDNSDLLRHLAYLYQITGNPQKAEAYYRRAEKSCRAELRRGEATGRELRHILARDAQTDY